MELIVWDRDLRGNLRLLDINEIRGVEVVILSEQLLEPKMCNSQTEQYLQT